jgi:guanylate kinase
MNGNLFVVVAPSGAGKTSLVNAMLKDDSGIQLSVSWTTRPPRSGESTGRDYHFVSRKEFEEMLQHDEFLEHAEVFGNLYGTSKSWITEARNSGRDVLLEIDWQGAQQVRRIFADTISIFILPPSMEILEQRLRARGKDSDEVIATRLAGAREEMRHVGEAEYIIVNDNFESALADLKAVVRAARLTRNQQLTRHHDLLRSVF